MLLGRTQHSTESCRVFLNYTLVDNLNFWIQRNIFLISKITNSNELQLLRYYQEVRKPQTTGAIGEPPAQPSDHTDRRTGLWLGTFLFPPLSPASGLLSLDARQLPPYTADKTKRYELRWHTNTSQRRPLTACHIPAASCKGRAVSYRWPSRQPLAKGRLWPSLVTGSHTLRLHFARAIPIMH